MDAPQSTSTPSVVSDQVPAPPRHPRAWIFVVIGGVLFLAVVCCAIVGLGGFRVFQNVQREVGQSLVMIDRFMRAGGSNDATTAAALFAPSAGISIEQLQRLFTERADAFAGYTAAKQTNYNVNWGPAGTSARISGTLQYSNHPDRGFTATLRKESGQWWLVSFQFNDGVEP